jgi:FKBP-type peptidyl-prolyl cis-trans isomerase
MNGQTDNLIRRIWQLLLLLLALAGTGTCAAAGFQQTPGGVGYRDLVTGNGHAVQTGDVVTVQVTGWVQKQGPMERAFIDTRKEGQPVQFRVGTTRIMPGLNEGVLGMRAGGHRLLRIPPKLGYGARAVEDIPPDSTLVFLVELLAVEPAAK